MVTVREKFTPPTCGNQKNYRQAKWPNFARILALPRLASLGYNLVGDRSGATFLGSPKVQSMDMLGVPSTVLKIDPMLRNNGGRTKTYALLPGSPAIDAIPLQYCQVKDIFNSQSGMYTDQRGMKRPDENESACDIGAYESSP